MPRLVVTAIITIAAVSAITVIVVIAKLMAPVAPMTATLSAVRTLSASIPVPVPALNALTGAQAP
jgi:hypothetical protein